MMLSDRELFHRLAQLPVKPGWNIIISPKPQRSAVQPASIDVTLGNMIKVEWGGEDVWRSLAWSPVNLDDYTDFDTEGGYPLMPGQVVLASTAEHVTIPIDLAADITGKSSLGRLFVTTHQTAGFIDPGFRGQITLEIKNTGPVIQRLKSGMRIGQLRFIQLTSPALRPYGSEGLGSHYQGQTGPTESAA